VWIVVVLVTNLITLGLVPLLTETSNCIFVATAIQSAEQAQSKSSQKELKGFNGVLLPDKDLSGDEEKDWAIAEEARYKKWERVKCGTVPGFKDQTGFLFKIVTDDDKKSPELTANERSKP